MSFRYERTELSRELVLWAMYDAPTAGEWSGMLDDASEWLADLERRGCRVAVVVDASGMGNATSSIRAAAGEWRAGHLPLIANTCRCAAYVADSAVMRSVLTAVFWFARPIVPVQICSSRDEAVEWVREHA